MKNPLNILKAYLKRFGISTLMLSRNIEHNEKGREKKEKLHSVSIFPFISLSCLVFCKYLIYTFSDIKSSLFVFSINRRNEWEAKGNRTPEKLGRKTTKSFLDFLAQLRNNMQTNRRENLKLKFKDNLETPENRRKFQYFKLLFLRLFVRRKFPPPKAKSEKLLYWLKK